MSLQAKCMKGRAQAIEVYNRQGSGGFLRVQDLRSQLERVQAAFRGNQQEASVSPREAAFSEVESPPLKKA